MIETMCVYVLAHYNVKSCCRDSGDRVVDGRMFSLCQHLVENVLTSHSLVGALDVWQSFILIV